MATNLSEMYRKLYEFIVNLDWSNPKIIVTAIILVMLPFFAKYLLMTGLIMGLVLAAGILFLVDKLPNQAKSWIREHPLIADLLLSALAVLLLGGQFGAGLTLGIGAAFCALILSLTLPFVKNAPVPEPVVA